MNRLFNKSWSRVFSGFFIDLAAGWVGAVVVSPNFSDLSIVDNKLVLTGDVIGAIFCLLVANWFEKKGEI